jgi:hypothetical protein
VGVKAGVKGPLCFLNWVVLLDVCVKSTHACFFISDTFEATRAQLPMTKLPRTTSRIAHIALSQVESNAILCA